MTSTAPTATRSEALTLTLLAPLSGPLVPLDAVPDEAFRQRMVGDGVAVDPTSDTVLAPCDATVLQVHRAKHAVTLEAKGVEIVIHVGLDTVKLGGDGLTPLVTAGQIVKAGEPLLRFAPDVVGRKAMSLLTPMIVANMDAVERVIPGKGRAEAGRSVMMTVRLKAAVPGGGAGAEGHGVPAATDASLAPAVRSEPIVIADPTGLHARPAAALAATAGRSGPRATSSHAPPPLRPASRTRPPAHRPHGAATRRPRAPPPSRHSRARRRSPCRRHSPRAP